MIIVSVMFYTYFLVLFLFSLISHPVYYCGFLVMNSLICSLISYLVFGFSWYSLLFCLIYIGGVYILFIFVSVYSPNSSHNLYFSSSYSYLFLLGLILLVIGCLFLYSVINTEFSSFLCNEVEGNFYISMCLTLLFGFFVLSLIISIKINYYR